MRINSIQKDEANITLDAGELVTIANVLYFYERHWQQGQSQESPPGERFHEIAKQIVTARDMCQYGHLDGHTLGCIVKHEIAAQPKGDLNRTLDGLFEQRAKRDEKE